MLVIRLQRTGRKGHAQFRVVVQDSRRTPSSGRVVALLGSYNPHTKEVQLNKELATKYLSNGAQPSDRVVRLLQAEKIDLPKWVKIAQPKQRQLRNAEKLRRNQPKEEAPAEEPVAETPAPDTEASASSEKVEAAEASDAPEVEAPASGDEVETEEAKEA